MGEVQSSCEGGSSPLGMTAEGLAVAEGTAAGGFSVKGLTEELKAAELEEAEPEALVIEDEAEEAALLALEATLLTIEVVELAADVALVEEAS